MHRRLVLLMLLAVLAAACDTAALPDDGTELRTTDSATAATDPDTLQTPPTTAPSTAPPSTARPATPASEPPGSASAPATDGTRATSAEPQESGQNNGEAPTMPTVPVPIPPDELVVESFPVPPGSRPHDVAPATDGGVWYTAQAAEALGWLDPLTGVTRHIHLGAGSRPHGVIVDRSGDAWVTDGGLNAIVKVDASTDEVVVYPLPDDRANANLNTATFDADGVLWFTGQNGVYGALDPTTGDMEVWDAPRGTGPYGIHTSPTGAVFYASLAGSYVGAIEEGGRVVELDPPTAEQGSRRVWFDSKGRAWVSQWNAGQLAVFDPSDQTWTEYPLPGPSPRAYAVYVDESDIVWVSDFGGNAMHRFDPGTETFFTFELPNQPSDVRQILGRPGEVWGAESAADALVVIRRG